MKDTKITAQEVLDSFNKEFSIGDMYEVYAGLIAYSMGWDEIDEAREKILTQALEFYAENCSISGIIHPDIIDFVDKKEKGKEEEVDIWEEM